MMQLMHREIDVFPGKRAQLSPTGGGRTSGASTVVTLQNLTPNENAFRVYVKSGTNVLSSSGNAGNPYWQDEWCTLKAMDAPPNDGVTDESGGSSGGQRPLSQSQGKQDQCGPKGAWVRVFVPRGGKRDVLIAFNLPERPDSRAGIYPFTVVVETSVSSDDGSGGGMAGQNQKPLELPSTLYVQPFERMQWELDVTPADKKVGLLRRRAQVSLVVRNRSNDWLYCDLEVPRSAKDVEMETFVHRVAVASPEPSETEAERRIALDTLVKMKTLRGEHHPLPFGIMARRVDAPSVPPPPSLDQFTGMDNGAVVAREMPNEPQQRVPTERAIFYCPPIPATVTGFFTWVTGNIKALLAAAVGLYVLVAFIYVGIHQSNWMKAETKTSLAPDGSVVVAGTHPFPFWHSHFFVREAEKLNDPWEELDETQVKWGLGSGTSPQPPAGPGAPPALPQIPSKLAATVQLDPKRWNKHPVQLGIRAGAFPFNVILFPSLFLQVVPIKGEIAVGNPPTAPQGGPDTSGRQAATSGELFIGNPEKNTLTIKIEPPLKDKPKSVSVGGDDYDVIKWQPKLVVKVPDTAQAAPGATVMITEADGKTLKVDGVVKVNGKDAPVVSGGVSTLPPLPDPQNIPPPAIDGGNSPNGGSKGNGEPPPSPGDNGSPVQKREGENGEANKEQDVVKFLTEEPPNWGAVISLAQTETTDSKHPEKANNLLMLSAQAYALLMADDSKAVSAHKLLTKASEANPDQLKTASVDAALWWAAMSRLNSVQNDPEQAAQAMKFARQLDIDHKLKKLTKEN